MASSKPQSAISYNTKAFLNNTLERLTSAGLLRHWVYIPHKGEKREDSDSVHDKDHIHLLLIPNKALNLAELEKEFREVEVGKAKPLGLVGLKGCYSVDDWVMYSSHDQQYLAMKGEVREYTYTLEDFVSDSPENVEEMYRNAEKTVFEPLKKIERLNRLGGAEAIRSGLFSINQANNIRAYTNMRINRPTTIIVDDKRVDPTTGVILSDNIMENVSRETSKSKKCPTKIKPYEPPKPRKRILSPDNPFTEGWEQTEVDFGKK